MIFSDGIESASGKLGKMAPSWMHSFSDGRSMADYVKYFKQDMRGLHAAQESLKILQALQDLGWKPDALVALNHGPENRLMEGQSESVQLSARMVNSVYPYNKKLASQPTISVDFWRHGGEQKLWSIYDYTESYLESCFTIEVTSLTQSNDGHSDPGDKIISSLALCTNNYAEPKSLPETSKRDRAEVMEEICPFLLIFWGSDVYSDICPLKKHVHWCLPKWCIRLIVGMFHHLVAGQF